MELADGEERHGQQGSGDPVRAEGDRVPPHGDAERDRQRAAREKAEGDRPCQGVVAPARTALAQQRRGERPRDQGGGQRREQRGEHETRIGPCPPQPSVQLLVPVRQSCANDPRLAWSTMTGTSHSRRLLVSTGPLAMSPLNWTFDAIADAGFDGAELLLAHNPESRDPEKVLAYAQEAGLDIPVVHGPYMVLLRTVMGSNYIEKTRRSLAVSAEIGARIMVAHAPFRWERGARGWVLSEVNDVAAGTGVTFAMENLFPVAGRNFSSVVTPEQLQAFPNVVFDTSHFGVSGIDLFQAWDALSERVAHLHVSDNFGNGKDSHAPIGSGILPLERFLARVGASDWSGTITLELDCRAYLDTRDSLVAFLARERVKAATLLAGGELDPPLAATPDPVH
ncbi:MAG: TIM barrel protein [Nitriliruptorales bacterium]|nr:TIM barrel protein [Nitriliruptorales bacterium]